MVNGQNHSNECFVLLAQLINRAQNTSISNTILACKEFPATHLYTGCRSSQQVNNYYHLLLTWNQSNNALLLDKRSSFHLLMDRHVAVIVTSIAHLLLPSKKSPINISYFCQELLFSPNPQCYNLHLSSSSEFYSCAYYHVRQPSNFKNKSSINHKYQSLYLCSPFQVATIMWAFESCSHPLQLSYHPLWSPRLLATWHQHTLFCHHSQPPIILSLGMALTCPA